MLRGANPFRAKRFNGHPGAAAGEFGEPGLARAKGKGAADAAGRAPSSCLRSPHNVPKAHRLMPGKPQTDKKPSSDGAKTTVGSTGRAQPAPNCPRALRLRESAENHA